MAHSIDLVMLDFDGTLVDSAPDIYSAALELIARHDRQPLTFQAVKTHIGEGFSGLIHDVFGEEKADPDFHAEMYAQFCSIYENHLLKTPQLYPGVIDFLETWPGRVAIVSNKPVRFIRPLMAALDLDRFPWVDVIGGDSLAFAKPHREPVDHVLRKSGCSALSAVLVGDGIQDVGAAQAAGVHLVAVDYGYVTIPRLRQQGARHFVSDLRDLPRVFTHLQPA